MKKKSRAEVRGLSQRRPSPRSDRTHFVARLRPRYFSDLARGRRNVTSSAPSGVSTSTTSDDVSESLRMIFHRAPPERTTFLTPLERYARQHGGLQRDQASMVASGLD